MNNRKVINNSCYNSYLHFLCWLKESLRQASKKELVHFFEREQTSPKVTEAKERALCGGGKKSFPSRRPAGGTTHSASLCIVLSPQPCYGRRIFSFTPHVAFTSLQPTIATSDIYYYHTNHLGSTAFVTDQNQNVTQGFLYAPYGEITTEFDANFGSDIIPKYSFNAKELDEETGMYYYEARYYKPPVFTSRDAMFEKKPWLSPYQYCSNNPVGRVDPSGCEDEITWVKKENGAIVFNSDVHDQADAESYYGENAECLYIGFQYKTKSGKECKLLENGYYLENGIKKKAPNEAPLFKKIGNAIKRFDEGGSYDGANMGTITPKDWKVGFAVVGVFAGAGATVETVAAGKVLSAVVSGLGTANCIDDACVNSEGKTPLERSMGEYSSVADYLKLGVNTANVVNGTYNWVKYSAESFNVASTVTSTVSTGQGAAKEIKK